MEGSLHGGITMEWAPSMEGSHGGALACGGRLKDHHGEGTFCGESSLHGRLKYKFGVWIFTANWSPKDSLHHGASMSSSKGLTDTVFSRNSFQEFSVLVELEFWYIGNN